jgi:hypothetical protein
LSKRRWIEDDVSVITKSDGDGVGFTGGDDDDDDSFFDGERFRRNRLKNEQSRRRPTQSGFPGVMVAKLFASLIFECLL